MVRLFFCFYSMNEMDAVLEVLEDQLTSIWTKTSGSTQGKGDIGELFAKYGVKQYFFNRGYKNRIKGSKTFAVYKKVKPGKKGKGGIDFVIYFTDSKGKSYELLLELKNFSHYKKGISPSNYKKWILNRFTGIDNIHKRKYYWALAINKRNVRYIWKRCNRDKINIIPIEEQLTNMYIYRPPLDLVFTKFMNEFDLLIYKIMSGWITK